MSQFVEIVRIVGIGRFGQRLRRGPGWSGAGRDNRTGESFPRRDCRYSSQRWQPGRLHWSTWVRGDWLRIDLAAFGFLLGRRLCSRGDHRFLFEVRVVSNGALDPFLQQTKRRRLPALDWRLARLAVHANGHGEQRADLRAVLVDLVQDGCQVILRAPVLDAAILKRA